MPNPVRNTLVFALLFAGLVISLGFYFQREHRREHPDRAVTVGIYQNAPKIYTDAAGRPQGPFVEMLDAMARAEGWRLLYQECAWADCLHMLAEGEIDIMPDVAYSPERAERFDFHSVPAVNSWSQVYGRPGNKIHRIVDLHGLRVAVLRDAVQVEYLQQLSAGSELAPVFIEVESYQAGFEAVHRGTAEAVVTNTFFGSRFASQYGLIETPVMFHPTGLYFATPKGKNQDLLVRIDEHLIRWREDSDSVYFESMRKAMLPAPVTVIPKWLKLTATGTAGGALLFLAFTLLLRRQVRRATADLRRTNRHLDRVLSASPVVLYQCRVENGRLTFTWVSPNIERLFGYGPAQVLEAGWFAQQLHPEDREPVLGNFERLPAQGNFTQEYRLFDASGRIRFIHDELHRADEEGEFIGTWTDLTQAVKQAAELRFLTQYEPVTGLPNRNRLHERLTRLLLRASGSGERLAVLAIDLDRFRHVNDTLGHVKGDTLLRTAAKTIEAMAGPDDVIARVGANQFMLVLAAEDSARQATVLAGRILETFSRPLSSDSPLIVTASIGISRFPEHGSDADTLLKNAEIALYEAKNKGRNTCREYATELSAAVEVRMATETALRGAVSRNELVLHYQPQFDLRTGLLAGAEALVRWNHPSRGCLLPREFISLAEETGLIHEIGAWIIRETCRQVKTWRDRGVAPARVAVNLSVLQLEQQHLPAQIARAIQEHGLAPSQLELEITESSIMREPEIALLALRELNYLGVSLAIDDFGTGHSSLAYLKRLPFHRVKIDQVFVRDIGRNANDEAICRTVIELGRTLGLETVAEGVEREEQAAFLRAEGCTFVQGYLYGRPLPADAFEASWLKHANPKPQSI